MSLKIAIQPDRVIHRNGERQSYSEHWHAHAKQAGLSAIAVDVFSDGALDEIARCDAFMWRPSPSAHPRLYAQRLLHAVEQGLGIPVFPCLNTRWHFEDKIAQHYYLSMAGIPTPRTWVLWTQQDAEAFCEQATYPFVLKLSSGYQARNVCLVYNREEALFFVDQLFGPGLKTLGYGPATAVRQLLRRARVAADIVRGRHPGSPTAEAQLEHGYFFAQEFLPDNGFDTRVTVIGDRAFAFRRRNRPGDFRASGSGLIENDPAAIDEKAIRLAFRVSRHMGAQTVAVDILRRGEEPIVIELTFSYASWAVRDCPGHWTLDGDPATGTLSWNSGSLSPEAAIFTDFVAGLMSPEGCDTGHTRRQETLRAKPAGGSAE